MSSANIARLTDRGVVSVDRPRQRKAAAGARHQRSGRPRSQGAARHAALLSPQGQDPVRLLRRSGRRRLSARRRRGQSRRTRETADDVQAPRRRRDHRRVVPTYAVYAVWGEGAAALTEAHVHPLRRSSSSIDGLRWLTEAPPSARLASRRTSHIAITTPFAFALGVPEGGKDYAFGDAYPHEADFDLFNGVSFTKGCYVGQEVVARMQNKTVVRKRVVKISAPGPLLRRRRVLGEVAIGCVGTVDGNTGSPCSVSTALSKRSRKIKTSPRPATS